MLACAVHIYDAPNSARRDMGGIVNAAVRLLAIIPAAVLSLLLLIRFRRRPVARFNRAVTNRITRRFASRIPSFGVIVHRGRKSGACIGRP